MNIIRPLEQILYFIRDGLWNYPDTIFFGRNSFIKQSYKIYLSLRPISHVILALFILIFPTSAIAASTKTFVRNDRDTLIEGVLVGIKENGELNSIQKVNPLVVSNIQIEKDLNNLIYESLVEVDVFNQHQNILVESIATNDRGDNYRIKLKENVFWHDSTNENTHKLTTADVQATFDMLEQLDNNPSTRSIYTKIANKRIKFLPVDEYRFEFQLEGAIPNFYELISFKILPAKYLQEVNLNNILTNEPFINRSPIGTGPFKLRSADKETISLVRNDDYHEEEKVSRIKNIRFRFFSDEDSLVDALKGGQIHSAAGLSTDGLVKLNNIKTINSYKTDKIYTQYYALYFNLAEQGPLIFKDRKMRQAISSAINRREVIDSIEGEGGESFGPIGQNSFAFVDISRFNFNKEISNKLLEELGWKRLPNEEYRIKDGKILEFSMSALDNIDRNKVSKTIAADLKDVGIKLNLDIKSNSDLINQNVLPRSFDTLLFSVNTFIDPDRFEFFHSSATTHPGLNIASYISEEKTVRVNDETKSAERAPEVDVKLERGRSFIDEAKRKEEYASFQNIIANEVPMVFLYHPILNYNVNLRVKGVDIKNANTLEERFKDIYKWEISL